MTTCSQNLGSLRTISEPLLKLSLRQLSSPSKLLPLKKGAAAQDQGARADPERAGDTARRLDLHETLSILRGRFAVTKVCKSENLACLAVARPLQ